LLRVAILPRCARTRAVGRASWRAAAARTARIQMNRTPELRVFLAVAAASLLLRGVLAAWLPITGDEAYFHAWGKNPDWGFYDHPPMVGWWLAALSAISDHPFVLRLPALLAPPAIGLMVAAVLARHGAAPAWSAATLMLLVPLNAWNVAITTDVPLMLFCAGTVAAYLRALRTGRAVDYLLTGLLLGGALLSKYFAGLLALAIFGHAVTRPGRQRFTGLLLIVLASLPAALLQVAWNAQNCWPNVMFNLVNRHDNAGWSLKTPMLYLVSLAYVLTPPVAWALARRGRGWLAAPERVALAWLAGLPFLLFALLSAVKTIGLHWLASFVMPAVMLFALGAAGAGAGSGAAAADGAGGRGASGSGGSASGAPPGRAMRSALRFAAAFAALHWLAIAVLAVVPIEWFAGSKRYPGIVMTLRPEALNERIEPLLDRYVVTARGYSPAVTLGFNLGRHVPVFGAGSSHARHDDILTDFRALDGRDVLVVSKDAPVREEYDPYFERVAYREEKVLGSTFHFVEGHGFRYEAYRDRVLEEIRQRWYAVPTWLPKGPCYFCDRYFPERACHR
jgi:uncharacterized membrane protein YgcG